MKKSLRTFGFILVVCALISSVAWADVKSKKVTFTQDVKVGETVIKKGEYKVTFDEQTGELSILDGKKVVAKTTAHLEARQKTARGATPVFMLLRGTEAPSVLSGINLGDKNAMINVDKADATTAAPTTSSQ